MERETPPLQVFYDKDMGQDLGTGIMILALATRHRVERPAIRMEGGTESYGAIRQSPSEFAFEKYEVKF